MKRIYLPALALFLAIGLFTLYLTQRTVNQVPIPEVANPLSTAPDTEVSGALELMLLSVEDSLGLLPQEDGFYLIDWTTLSKVDFEPRFNEAVNDEIYYPLFHSSIKMLDGQPIQIKGYVIPFQETGDEKLLILSAFPFSNCFFCGNAGPESVMDIQLKDGIRANTLKQDEKLSFRGTLRLNDTDLYYLNYILEEAEIAP